VGPFHCKQEDVNERIPLILATCKAIAPLATEAGVIIALENVMPGPATNLVRMALHELDSDLFGLCYDSSHDQIDGPRPFDLINEFRDRIFAIHLSDRIREHVDHVIPGDGFIAWPDLCATLRLTNYTGPVLMEVMTTHSKYNEPVVFLREAYSAAARLGKIIYGHKNIEQGNTADS
jgi:sugar phosphate isomerase/epimerase